MVAEGVFRYASLPTNGPDSGSTTKRGEGGGLLTLVERERGTNRAEALRWLEASGFLDPHERQGPSESTARPLTRISKHNTADAALEARRAVLAAKLWAHATTPDPTPARAYLSGRLAWPPNGLGPDLPATVRWLPRCHLPRHDPQAKWYGLPIRADGVLLFAWRPPDQVEDAPPTAVSLIAITADGERLRWFKADGPKIYALGARRGTVFTARAGEGGAIHLTEGEVDALALACQGFEGVVRATGGTSGFGVEAVADPIARPVVLYPDGDRGGFVAAAKAQARILATGRACRIAWREIGSGDPADDLATAVAERAALRAEADEDRTNAHSGAWHDFFCAKLQQ